MKNKANLFKLSMQINEILFLLHIDSFSESILFYLDNFKKLNLTDEELKKVQKGFSALFFVFPVVSTSLASSYTMLKYINVYGTLLCDESGQATPQSLVGALNRANNAMIVGDPLQVEPVFTAPDILIKILANKYEIDDIHSPLASSAQQLADNSNIYGSYYKVNNQKIWVGMPLVVHRRCVDPMFSISNEISYNNKMVLETPSIKGDDDINNLPASSWIDVVSSSNDFKSNSSIKEIQAYFKFINKYNAYVDGKHFVISPFKSIYEVFETQEEHIGTVHTFQGKEADIVFLILGGNVETGAKNWVSSKANILNVAATRAKKRFYIIGDYNKWKTHNYFKSAVKNLSIIDES
jgi:superfamily I DNA and/or RNA helicase